MARSTPNNSLSKREGDLLVEAGRRVLLDGGYPNPERVGCPGSELLKALAERRIHLREAEEWIHHVGMCSPCFIEYNAFRERLARRRRVEFALAGVALLIVIGIGGWRWKFKWGQQTHGQLQEITLDLRNYLVLRGQEPPPSNKPLELRRGRLDLVIYLPVGSREGDYELQIVKEPDKVLASATGSARMENHNTVLEVKIDVSMVPAGGYLLRIRRPGLEWSNYPVAFK